VQLAKIRKMTEFLTFTLPSGIRCIHKRVRSAVTYCALTINAGSRDELPGEHGMAHFVEHGLFKGTARRNSYHISSRLENLGGELNAFTTKEDTTINATTLKGDFAKAAELIADMVFNSTFPEHQIEREKQVIVDEINSYRDMPQEMLFNTFDGLMFADSPLGRSVEGTTRSVTKFNSEKLKSFVARTYTPDQMVFSAVGNMSEKAFVATCERYFGAVPPSKRQFSRQVPPPLVAPFEKVVSKGANHQSHCLLGGRAYSLLDDRRLVLSLLVNVLGGPGANSRLNNVLRERNGLTYNIDSSFIPYSDTGFVNIYFSCERDKIARCRELIDVELQRIMSSPLTPRALSMAKKQFIGQFAISMDSSESYMLGAAKSLLIYNEIDPPQTVVGKVNEITADNLMTTAQDLFGSLSSVIYR
jgi:predicted Zn-dependent peptidase